MRRLVRTIWWAILLVIVLPSTLGTAVTYIQGWPDSWRSANWSSARLLPDPAHAPEASVHIFAARSGRWKSIFADHTWIVLKPENGTSWQRYDVVGWGTPIRHNAYDADGRWYGNRPRVIRTITGPEAARLIPRIENAIARYPWGRAGTYSVWPGPNSNTFVAWVLRAVPDIGAELPARAIGKDYLGPGLRFAKTPSATGWQMSLYGVAGLALARDEGLELHILGATIGLDPQNLAVKLPAFGALGFL